MNLWNKFYSAGWLAQKEGLPFDESKPEAWKKGWKDRKSWL